MVQKTFGGNHTIQKMKIIELYLTLYSTVLKNQPFKKMYIDAFAGSGEIPQRNRALEKTDLFTEVDLLDEKTTVIKGSAQRAMDLKSPFDKYVFIEKKRSNLDYLKKKFNSHARFDRCCFLQDDANIALLKICKETNWDETRAVVFLDPFGNQVAWDTIGALAKTGAVDLWYLFPSANGVCRQVSNDGQIHETHIKSLVNLFGSRKILDQLVTIETGKDLFGNRKITKKTATVKSVTELMMEQMKNVFKGGVLDQWVPLGKNNQSPSFSLIFAWANPNQNASILAEKLSKAVLNALEE